VLREPGFSAGIRFSTQAIKTGKCAKRNWQTVRQFAPQKSRAAKVPGVSKGGAASCRRPVHERTSPGATVNSGCREGQKPDLANCYARSAILGRNSITAITAIRMKIANTTACVIANGGSDCVGASALRPETFAKLCATRTNTFK
jgi:hypothetical protein